jgi:dephospho-CoA kinase
MAANRPLRIGLTGGIASGKSTVADMFAEKGVPVIDTDVIAREVVQPGEPALAEIEEAFGPEVIDSDGSLHRRRLREQVFNDDQMRKRLEAILHPRIRDAAMAQADFAGGPYQVIVVPLLVGSPMQSLVDRILVVDVSESTQLERLVQRDAESEAQARRMISAQASREDRLAIADDVVVNDGPLRDTADQVGGLHQKYLALAARD